jgi:antitoxin YefM
MYVIYARCHMKRVRVNEDIRPMSEFRIGIASFLKQIHDTKRPLIITQHGKGVAVLLDAGEYEAMLERIELLQDIQTSIGQIEAGQGVDNDRAKQTVLNRIRK